MTIIYCNIQSKVKLHELHTQTRWHEFEFRISDKKICFLMRIFNGNGHENETIVVCMCCGVHMMLFACHRELDKHKNNKNTYKCRLNRYLAKNVVYFVCCICAGSGKIAIFLTSVTLLCYKKLIFKRLKWPLENIFSA